MSTPTIEAVSEPCILGESPLWHPVEQVLYWCDIPGRALHRFDPANGARMRWDFPCEPACVVAHADGGFLLGMRDGIWHFDTASGVRRMVAAPPYDPARERFNDGKCDAQGRFWIGTIYEPRDPPLAALYRWADGTLQRMADGITVSNGLAWSPSGEVMYWSDTKAHTVYAFDADAATGVIERRRVFASFPGKQPGQDLDTYGGRPDGATVDAEGCYWVAMFEGQRVLRLSPSGHIVDEVRLPVRCPTMPCLGGADGRTLYVTTARENRPADELRRQPLAGCVLAFRVDVPGLPAAPARRPLVVQG